MLVFTLFALINLCIGYAVAVLLGHGPDPWYAIFLPAAGNDVVQIDALEADAGEPSGEAHASAEDDPVAEAPRTVNYPFPEMNEPEDQPPEDDQPDNERLESPGEEPQLDAHDEPASADSAGEDDDDIEKFLAAGKSESASEQPAAEEGESLTNDDIATMFAAQDDSENVPPPADNSTAEDGPTAESEPAAEAEPDTSLTANAQADADEDTADDTAAEAVTEEAETEATLGQDDIAALFNQV